MRLNPHVLTHAPYSGIGVPATTPSDHWEQGERAMARFSDGFRVNLGSIDRKWLGPELPIMLMG